MIGKITIDSVFYIRNYILELKFSDGKVTEVNFQPFLERSKNPMTNKYLDKNEFKKFYIEYGDLTWNDYEMCFPIWDLYQGKI